MNTINMIASRDMGTDAGFVAKRLVNEHVKTLLNSAVKPEQVNPEMMNQKGIKRLVQLASFAISGDYRDFDEVTAFMVSAVLLTKQSTVSFKDAQFLCGLGQDDAKHISGVSRAKLARFFKRETTAGTITSKVSRTAGKRGFFTALGITAKSDAHSFTLTDSAKTNPLLLAYAHQLERMTDDALHLLQKGKN